MTAEAVHFDEQLVESLFLFVVTAAETCTAASADCIYFIYENDSRRCFSCRIEKVAHTGSTDADIHFHKVGTRDGEERHASFACNSLGKQGFTRSGRAYEKHAVRNLGTQLHKLARVAQVFDNLAQFFLFFIGARHIGEINARFFIHAVFCLCLAEGIYLAAAANAS